MARVNVWAAKQAEIDALKAEVARLTELPFLREFATDLGNNMLTTLAMTPYQDWPQFAKTAFAWSARKAPTAAYLYKNTLPKGD